MHLEQGFHRRAVIAVDGTDGLEQAREKMRADEFLGGRGNIAPLGRIVTQPGEPVIGQLICTEGRQPDFCHGGATLFTVEIHQMAGRLAATR